MPLARSGVALGLGGEALFEFNKFLVGQIGEMKWEQFNLNIRKLKTYEEKNIVCKNEIIYLDKEKN